MIAGRMFCLDSVLTTENQYGPRYILVVEGDSGYEMSFGRNRKLNVSSECYIVTFSEDGYELEKIEFYNGECDYLKVLKERNVTFEIPKVLPKSCDRMYSRFECAVGDTYWSKYIEGYFGVNGYAITTVGYVGDDRYENCKVDLNMNPGSLHIGEHSITGITGFKRPNYEFIEKLLEENVQVEEGEPIMAMLREAGITEDDEIEQICFETEDE